MNSLRGRLLIAASSILILFVFITALALERADYVRAEEAVEHRLQGLVYSVLSAVEVNADGEIEISDAALPEARFAQFDSGLGALVVETDGSIIWRTTSLLRDPQVPIALPTGAWRLTVADESYPFFSLALGVGWALDEEERRFSVVVVEDSSAFLAQRAKFRRTLWIWLGTSAVMLLGMLLGILAWGLSPMRRLTAEILSLQSGKQASISDHYPEELRPLGQALNTLISNERLRQSRYRLALDDLAHSLKTPLAVLRTEVGDDPNCQAPLQNMQQQIDYHLKRALAGSGRSFGKHTELNPIIGQIITALGKVYADKDIRFEQQLDDTLMLPLERGDLMEVLGNLLENASKWCQQSVMISAQQQAGRIIICIEDDGPGFPDNADQLLNRGIRADLQKEGQGIGLALVNDIVNSLGGEIQLDRSSKLRGACVRLSLPGN